MFLAFQAENGKVADYDSTAPIEVSYQKPFEGEPTGRKNPELLYNPQAKPRTRHGNRETVSRASDT